MLRDQNDEPPKILGRHPTYPAKLCSFAKFHCRRSRQLKDTKMWQNRYLGLDPGLNSPE